MWWDIERHWRQEFENWHSHEHFPERMSIPGFLRGSRWISAQGNEGFFVLYELERYETLVSPAYLERLNSPTPWSTRLMPQHRNMVRSQCRVVDSVGGMLGRYVLTLRLTPVVGAESSLQAYLADHARTVAQEPGISGAHLLVTQTPDIPATTEQRIRGGRDREAAWIYLVTGYEIGAMVNCHAELLGAETWLQQTDPHATWSDTYTLSHTLESPSLSVTVSAQECLTAGTIANRPDATHRQPGRETG